MTVINRYTEEEDELEKLLTTMPTFNRFINGIIMMEWKGFYFTRLFMLL